MVALGHAVLVRLTTDVVLVVLVHVILAEIEPAVNKPRSCDFRDGANMSTTLARERS